MENNMTVPDIEGRDQMTGFKSPAVRDETMPDGSWKFDESVTDAFDDMLARSIPQYEIMRETVAALATDFADGGGLVDLGSSRGEAIATVKDRAADAFGSYTGYEVSDPMIEAARRRFADEPSVRIEKHDLRDPLPRSIRPDAILSILTLQFVPIEHRQRVLDDVNQRLRPGGAFILVEKVLGDGARIDGLLVDHYYDVKRLNGYTQEAIDRKRLSLEGVLVPVTASMNVEFLRSAGFRKVDCFWRFLNFAGWIAIS